MQQGDGGIEDQRDEAGDDEQHAALCRLRSRAPRRARSRAAAARAGSSAARPCVAARRGPRLCRGRASSARGASSSSGGRARGPCSGTPPHVPPTIARVWLSLRRPNRQPPTPPRGPTPARILFVGDVVGGIGRRTLLDCLPVLRERYAPTFVVVNGENAPAVSASRRRSPTSCSRAGRRRDHARQPHLPPPRHLPLPRHPSRASCARPTSCAASPGTARACVERDGVRLGVVNLSGNLYLRAGRSAFTRDRGRARPSCGDVDHVLVDMHAEATSEKVAMGWHLDGRVTAVRRHPHARADRRRARAARRHGLHHRRRHDRAARRRDRRQARAGDRVALDPDARALRDLRGGPVADGRPDQLLTATRADSIGR